MEILDDYAHGYTDVTWNYYCNNCKLKGVDMSDYLLEALNRLILILPVFLLGVCIGRRIL